MLKLTLLLCGFQDISIPPSITVERGDFTTIKATTAGKLVRFFSIDPRLKVFPSGMLKDDMATVVTCNVTTAEANKNNKVKTPYKLLAWTAVNGAPTEAAVCLVTVVDSQNPDPAPNPDPTPVPDGKLGLTKVSFDSAMKVEATARKSQIAKLMLAQTSCVTKAKDDFAGVVLMLEFWQSENAKASTPEAWAPWGAAVAAKLEKLFRDGVVRTGPQFSDAFAEIESGLVFAAKK